MLYLCQCGGDALTVRRKGQQPLAAVGRGGADRQHAARAQPLYRCRYIGFRQPAVAADVAGSAAIRVVMQEQQDVDLQLVQPMADRGGFKLGCIELFIVLIKKDS